MSHTPRRNATASSAGLFINTQRPLDTPPGDENRTPSKGFKELTLDSPDANSRRPSAPSAQTDGSRQHTLRNLAFRLPPTPTSQTSTPTTNMFSRVRRSSSNGSLHTADNAPTPTTGRQNGSQEITRAREEDQSTATTPTLSLSRRNSVEYQADTGEVMKKLRTRIGAFDNDGVDSSRFESSFDSASSSASSSSSSSSLAPSPAPSRPQSVPAYPAVPSYESHASPAFTGLAAPNPLSSWFPPSNALLPSPLNMFGPLPPIPAAAASPAVASPPMASASPSMASSPMASASPAMASSPMACASPSMASSPVASASPAESAEETEPSSPDFESGQPLSFPSPSSVASSIADMSIPTLQLTSVDAVSPVRSAPNALIATPGRALSNANAGLTPVNRRSLSDSAAMEGQHGEAMEEEEDLFGAPPLRLDLPAVGRAGLPLTPPLTDGSQAADGGDGMDMAGTPMDFTPAATPSQMGPEQQPLLIDEATITDKGLTIPAHVLCRLLSGAHPLARQYVRIIVLDCRYPYEYAAGHIRGAYNADFTHSNTIARLFFELERGFPRNDSCRTLIVVHCEFSSHRAPTVRRAIREMDRLHNAANYPYLSYPELYVLEGGYSRWFNTVPVDEWCVPSAYLPCRTNIGTLRRTRSLPADSPPVYAHHELGLEDPPTEEQQD